MEMKEHLSISDKIEIMKLACTQTTYSFIEAYQKIIDCILNDRPTAEKQSSPS